METGKKLHSRSAVLFIGGLFALTLALVITAPGYSFRDVRGLLDGYPSRAAYSWLRNGLDNARQASNRVIEGGNAVGTLAAARAVEAAIQSSRSSARRSGTKPIPLHMRERFEDYFPEDLLDKVRWAYPNRNLDLGSVAAWYQNEGSAITLKDTIVYSNEVGVSSELLWAHELTHAVQYEELGLRGFARVYTTNLTLLERQASDNAARIVRDLRAKRRTKSLQTRS